MRLFGLVGMCTLALFALCSCGSSGGGAGAIDASADASMDASRTDGGPFDSPADVPGTDALSDAPVDAPLDSAVSSACDNAGLLAGCMVGVCTVSGTGKPLPDGMSITVTQKTVPSDLNGDTLGSVLCSIALPADAGVQTVANLNLSISLSAAPDSNAVLFQYVSPSLSRAVPTSRASGNAVVGLVTAPGDFGATERPGPSNLEATVGIDMSPPADQVSLLRNLSSQTMYAAFYDGSRLFVCNGPRLLVYSGIPKDPSVKPDLVLGQPDLNTASTQPTSSLFQSCLGVWSDGTRLVLASGNRILIWNAMPTQDAAPADLVLGQPDFSSNKANNGGISATSLSLVGSVDSDGTRLAAAEIGNNRVLVWNKFPTMVDQPADFEIGQPGFTTNQIENGATPIYQAWGVLLDSHGLLVSGQFFPGVVHIPTLTANNAASDFTVLPFASSLQPPDITYTASRMARTPGGGLAVRDAVLYRIAMLKAFPTGPAHIDFVLGQPDVTRIVSSPVTASLVSTSTAGEQGLGAGKDVVLVPDSRRLLVFDTPPSFNFEPASRVIGQAGFTTNGTVDYRGVSGSTLAGPADVALASGLVAVADRGNNRVLLYKASDLAANTLAASVVLGQPDGTSYVPNLDQQTPSAQRMSGPAGVALDGTHLIVADSENHRVLIWKSVPTATGTAADLVLGQATFSDRRPNRGRGDANGDGYSDANADGFFYPIGVASDGTHLFVADRLNNRVLVWKTFPTSNGQSADAVIGEPDFTSSQPNRGNGIFTFVPDGLDLPTGITLVGTSLWIADTENNRIARWDNVTTTPVFGRVVGQVSDSAVSNPNYNLPSYGNVGFFRNPTTDANSMLRPHSVAFAGGRLFVSESDSNRVHMFDSSTFAPAGELGQASDTTATANASGISAASLSAPMGIASDGTTLWVSDSANHRVLAFDASMPLATGASARQVLGQTSFVLNGFDQASTAAGGVTSQPGGIALASGALYVADTGNNRVLVLQTPVSAGQAPMRVYGQPDTMLALPNSGGSPSARTLSAPRGIFVDNKHVIIADTGNNRVLVYDPNAGGTDAQLVLGQSTFSSTSANAGGVSASALQAPAGVYTDGTSLWVADTGNHRVLEWKSFPTSNGQAADLVFGQTSFASALPNQGGSAATAASLCFPSGIDAIGGVVYIADTGNNRVVSFSTIPSASGASADGVLGQADLGGRGAAVMGNDLGHLAGPIGIAHDSENLYVTDRDLGRIIIYPLGTIVSGGPASMSISASTGLSMTRPSAVAVERTAFFTSRLYVADTGDDRVEIIQSVSRLVSP